jgi:hypothetical protein
MLGVREFFLDDPLGEYLQPPLQGYQLQQGEYQRMPPAAEGSVASQVLGLELQLEAGHLRVVNPVTGERLLTPAEALAAQRAEAAAQALGVQLQPLEVRGPDDFEDAFAAMTRECRCAHHFGRSPHRELPHTDRGPCGKEPAARRCMT